MKIWFVVIVLALVGAGFWFIRSQGSDSSIAIEQGISATDSAVDASAPDADNTGSEISKSEARSDLQTTDVVVESVDETQTAEQATIADKSPFDVVQPEQASSETDTSPTTQTVLDAPQQPDSTTSRVSGEPVIVPQSYPVTDAAKYFVPREERGPGNLGGPPPLDFPGGPSDPARQDSGAFAPPPAPGQ